MIPPLSMWVATTSRVMKTTAANNQSITKAMNGRRNM